jgi:hypothetical protein
MKRQAARPTPKVSVKVFTAVDGEQVASSERSRPMTTWNNDIKTKEFLVSDLGVIP